MSGLFIRSIFWLKTPSESISSFFLADKLPFPPVKLVLTFGKLFAGCRKATFFAKVNTPLLQRINEKQEDVKFRNY